MKRRKKKWPKGVKPKLHQGGVLNESQKLSVDDVILKVELAGRRFTTRLEDTNDFDQGYPVNRDGSVAGWAG